VNVVPTSAKQHDSSDFESTKGFLTKRELEVLQLLSEGATHSEISRRMRISPMTTRNHFSAIFRKLGVNSRTQALVRAISMGWVRVD